MFEIFGKRKVSDLPITLHNTLGNKDEVFVPREPGRATMYSCGPTVYDHSHIGNLRPYVMADLIKRMLVYNGYSVKLTINITDFGHLVGDGDHGEDKMVSALKREGMPVTLPAMRELTLRYTASFKDDLQALNAIDGVVFTPASEYIKEEIALVRALHEKGYTYETSDGLYFDISRFPAYGRLGNIDLEKLKQGARVEVNHEKKHPADFAVWKKGELGWESPWGKGFPGWHIECTAMAFATLGKQIDIHTGGEDLIHTHHNGEIAQAESATGKAPYVGYWMHNAFITIDNKKISKSLGNTIRLTQLIERNYDPLTLRYWFLTGHYSTPMNFTFEALDGAKTAYQRLRKFVYSELTEIGGTIDERYEARFHTAINNNLDTAHAVAVLWELVKDAKVSLRDKRATIEAFDEVLGLGLSEARDSATAQTFKVLEIQKEEELPADVRDLMKQREIARAEKRWDDADALRQAINMQGYTVEDSPKGMRITKSA